VDEEDPPSLVEGRSEPEMIDPKLLTITVDWFKTLQANGYFDGRVRTSVVRSNEGPKEGKTGEREEDKRGEGRTRIRIEFRIGINVGDIVVLRTETLLGRAGQRKTSMLPPVRRDGDQGGI